MPRLLQSCTQQGGVHEGLQQTAAPTHSVVVQVTSCVTARRPDGGHDSNAARFFPVLLLRPPTFDPLLSHLTQLCPSASCRCHFFITISTPSSLLESLSDFFYPYYVLKFVTVFSTLSSTHISLDSIATQSTKASGISQSTGHYPSYPEIQGLLFVLFHLNQFPRDYIQRIRPKPTSIVTSQLNSVLRYYNFSFCSSLHPVCFSVTNHPDTG